MTREELGRLVRETWVKWASEQPYPKASWLVPWDDLGADDREADMRIGEAVAAAERERMRPLMDAYHHFYDTVWNKTGTVEIDLPGYNGLSYEDSCAIDEAAEAVERLLAGGS